MDAWLGAGDGGQTGGARRGSLQCGVSLRPYYRDRPATCLKVQQKTQFNAVRVISQHGLHWVRKSAYNCRLSPICALRPSVSPGALATVSSGIFPWQTPHKHASAHAKPSFRTLTTRLCARVCVPQSRASARLWPLATRLPLLLHSRPLKARSTASLTRRSSTRTRLHAPSRVCPLPSRQWLLPKFG